MNVLPHDIIVELVVVHDCWCILPGVATNIIDELYHMFPTKTLEELIVWRGIESFERLRQREGLEYQTYMLRAAIRSDAAEVIDHFISAGQSPPANAIDVAAEYDKRRSFEHLYRLGYRPTESTIRSAAKHGNLSLLKSLVAAGVPPDETSIIEAARNGHRAVVEYLVSIRVPGLEDAMCAAASEGQLAIVMYLQSIGVPVNEDTMYTAVAHGQLTVVNYLHEVGITVPIDEAIDVSVSPMNECIDTPPTFVDEYISAIKAGKLGVVCEMFRHHRSRDELALMTAAEAGQILVLKFFWEQGVRPTIPTHLADVAAASGRLSIVDFLYTQGMRASRNITDIVVRNGHLAVLKYLHHNGHPLPSALEESEAELFMAVAQYVKINYRASSKPFRPGTIRWYSSTVVSCVD